MIQMQTDMLWLHHMPIGEWLNASVENCINVFFFIIIYLLPQNYKMYCVFFIYYYKSSTN